MPKTYRLQALRLAALVLLAALAAFAAFIGSPASTKLSCTPDCNVILIIEDALAAQHLKTHGYDRDTMPETTAFFEQGVIFEQASAVSPWTLPSFSAMYFSDLPSRITYRDLKPDARPNLQSELRNAQVTIRAVVPSVGLFIYDVTSSPFRADELVRPYTDAMENATEALKKIEADSKPFFLVVHGLKTHDPYAPKAPYDRAFGESDEYAIVSMMEILRENADPKRSPRTVDVFKLRYDQGILQEDAALAKFLHSIPQKMLVKTVIIFTSDHGEAFDEHGSLWHAASLHQEEIHVPLMVRAPGLSPRRVAEPVSGLDIAPTILAAMGREIPPHFQGKSLIPLLFGGSLGKRVLPFENGFPFYLHFENGTPPQMMSLKATGAEGTDKPLINATQHGARLGDYKIFTEGRTGGNLKIFNVVEDPMEKELLSPADTRIPRALISTFLSLQFPGELPI